VVVDRRLSSVVLMLVVRRVHESSDVLKFQLDRRNSHIIATAVVMSVLGGGAKKGRKGDTFRMQRPVVWSATRNVYAPSLRP